jgi:ATP-dependent DNA ligase
MRDLFRRYRDLQLASLVDAPLEGDGWLHEIKYDRYRLLAFLDDGEVRLFTRKRNNWTCAFRQFRHLCASSKRGLPFSTSKWR